MKKGGKIKHFWKIPLPGGEKVYWVLLVYKNEAVSGHNMLFMV